MSNVQDGYADSCGYHAAFRGAFSRFDGQRDESRQRNFWKRELSAFDAIAFTSIGTFWKHPSPARRCLCADDA